MGVEVVVGILAHSLALLSDAAHMLTDAGALAMSLVVLRLVKRPAAGNLTFGFKRAEILSAQANGGTLLVLALLIVYEGVTRLVSPPPAEGKAILVVALTERPFEALARIDNRGTPGRGPWQFLASVTENNRLGWHESLNVTYAAALESLKKHLGEA